MCKKTRPLQQIFEQLSNEFTRQDVERLMKRYHRTIPVEEILFRFKAQGLIRTSSRNHYFKIKKLYKTAV